MMLFRILNLLAQKAGLRHISPNGGDERVPIRQLAEHPDRWLAQNGCFGPLRIYIRAPRMEEARILLHLRDPRDVLVSMFFSYCYSHSGETKGNSSYRGEVSARGIDDFVWRMATADASPVTGDYGTGNQLWDLAGNVLQRYQCYVSNLLDRQNVALVRYEDMVSEPKRWLRSVFSVFGFDSPNRIERLAEVLAPEFKVSREDQWSHKRQIYPGDYRRKLRSETIDRLDDAFSDVLLRLGYLE